MEGLMRLIRLGGPGNDMPPVRVGKEMRQAFDTDVESYMPVYAGLQLQPEGGVSENSYKNLCALMERLGKPIKVVRKANGNVLVHFPSKGEGHEPLYLATGFDCGYLGTGPCYFARFGYKAGFAPGDEDETNLYLALSDKPRNYVGVIWERTDDDNKT